MIESVDITLASSFTNFHLTLNVLIPHLHNLTMSLNRYSPDHLILENVFKRKSAAKYVA